MEEVSLPMPRVQPRAHWHRRAEAVTARVLPAALSALRGGAWSLGSVAIVLGVWQLVCLTISKDFPTPLASLRVTIELLGNAFIKVDGMPGIGFQVLASMRRIGASCHSSAVTTAGK